MMQEHWLLLLLLFYIVTNETEMGIEETMQQLQFLLTNLL